MKPIKYYIGSVVGMSLLAFVSVPAHAAPSNITFTTDSVNKRFIIDWTNDVGDTYVGIDRQEINCSAGCNSHFDVSVLDGTSNTSFTDDSVAYGKSYRYKVTDGLTSAEFGIPLSMTAPDSTSGDNGSTSSPSNLSNVTVARTSDDSWLTLVWSHTLTAEPTVNVAYYDQNGVRHVPSAATNRLYNVWFEKGILNDPAIDPADVTIDGQTLSVGVGETLFELAISNNDISYGIVDHSMVISPWSAGGDMLWKYMETDSNGESGEGSDSGSGTTDSEKFIRFGASASGLTWSNSPAAQTEESADHIRIFGTSQMTGFATSEDVTGLAGIAPSTQLKLTAVIESPNTSPLLRVRFVAGDAYAEYQFNLAAALAESGSNVEVIIDSTTAISAPVSGTVIDFADVDYIEVNSAWRPDEDLKHTALSVYSLGNESAGLNNAYTEGDHPLIMTLGSWGARDAWSHDFSDENASSADFPNRWHAPQERGGRDFDDWHIGKQRRNSSTNNLESNYADFSQVTSLEQVDGNSVLRMKTKKRVSDAFPRPGMSFLKSFAGFSTMHNNWQPSDSPPYGNFRDCSGGINPCDLILDPTTQDNYLEVEVSLANATHAYKNWWAFWLFAQKENYNGRVERGMEVDMFEYVPYVSEQGFNGALFRHQHGEGVHRKVQEDTQDWYLVQSVTGPTTICEGLIDECVVEDGTYRVINESAESTSNRLVVPLPSGVGQNGTYHIDNAQNKISWTNSNNRNFTARNADVFLRSVNVAYREAVEADPTLKIDLTDTTKTIKIGIYYTKDSFAFYLNRYRYYSIFQEGSASPANPNDSNDPDVLKDWITSGKVLGVMMTWEKDQGSVIYDNSAQDTPNEHYTKTLNGLGLSNNISNDTLKNTIENRQLWTFSPIHDPRLNNGDGNTDAMAYGPWGQGFLTNIYTKKDNSQWDVDDLYNLQRIDLPNGQTRASTMGDYANETCLVTQMPQAAWPTNQQGNYRVNAGTNLRMLPTVAKDHFGINRDFLLIDPSTCSLRLASDNLPGESDPYVDVYSVELYTRDSQ